MLRWILAFVLCACLGSAQVHAGGTGAREARLAELIERISSPDPEYRAQAGQELLAMRADAIPALLEAATSRNMFLAGPARELLTSLGPEAFDDLMKAAGTDYSMERLRRKEAAAAVARMGPVVLPRAVAVFTTANAAGGDFAFAESVLGRLGSQSTDSLIPLLRHPSAGVRQWASTLLAQIADPRAYDAFVAGLESDDVSVRAESARGLGNLKDHRAAEPLLATLKDQKRGVRRSAASSLGKIYEPRFFKPLAQLARSDEEKAVRDTAANVLMSYSNDPVAIRVGRRYKPLALSPAAETAIHVRVLIRILGTCVGLLASAFLVIGRKGARGCIPVGVAAVLVLVLGLLWGGGVENIWGVVEDGLLFVFVPAIAVAGWLGAWLWSQGTGARRAWLGTTACFYAGYGVGWLALWGYLGF